MNPSPRSNPNRRDFLRSTGLVLAGLGLAGCGREADAKKVRVGLQLYSLRQECKTDLPGMLAAVSRIGYQGVEFAGYHGRNAKELRKMLDDNGLVACGTHTAYDTVVGDKLKPTIEFNQVIGNRFLIVPSVACRTKQDWLDKAAKFDDIAGQLQPEGMFVGYHAHAPDFKKLEGEFPWDILFSNTKPAVIMQLDTGNCWEGGGDPLAVLRKYPGRARSIHVKAAGGGPEAVIGEDKLDWNAIFGFCETKGGTEWYVLEHETSADPLAAVRRSFAAFKKFGRA